MQKITIIFIGLFMLFSSHLVNAQSNAVNRFKLSSGIITGYNGGYGFQANFTVHKPAQSFPMELRFGIGYNIMNPGDALDARRIFINNATNGIPKEKGHSIDYRLDFLVAYSIFKIKHSYIVFGPRYSSFLANFNFVGGNEDFDVKSKQWGIGLGAESHFKMAAKIDLLVSAGLDYYFPSTLYGHDTSYSPDDQNINTRNDNENNDEPFTYNDADAAINQPKFTPRLMIGINYRLK